MSSMAVSAMLLGGVVPFQVSVVFGQPTATLTDKCETDGSSAHYEETISGTGSTMVRNSVSDSGCPNHVNYAINPNDARFITSDAKIPAYPMLIDSAGGTVDLSEANGQIGVLFNGVAAFSGWAGDGAATTYENSAMYLEGDTFDLCGGHATATGWYHYHNTAGCLQEQAMVAANSTASEHSPQLGWSYDGFPIYGQLGAGGVEMLMCGNSGADGTYCLDLCSGYEGELAGVDGFKYRYYASCGFNELYFPFTTNCYRGCCPSGMICERHMEDCGASAVGGYASDYTPEPASSLASVYDASLIEGDDTDMIAVGTAMNCSLFLGSYGDDLISGASSHWRPLGYMVMLSAVIVATLARVSV